MQKHPCSPNDAKMIEKSTYAYTDKNTAIHSSESSITSMQCVRNYASLKVHPTKPTTDDAIVYLHKTKKQWEVMSLGTSFDEKLLAKLPKELR
jgi:hypothetical protein